MNGCSRYAAVLAAAAWVGAASFPAQAQDKKVPTVGFVAGAGGYPKMAITNQTFFDALAEKGYKDGSTMRVVFRSAEGDMGKMPDLVRQVLSENADVLVVSSSPGCAAAAAATADTPVLCISVQDDPVREGLTDSLERGRGNVVGVHSHLADGIEQQLDGLLAMKPGATRIGVLFNPENKTHLRLLELWKSSAAAKQIQIVDMRVTKAADLDAALKAALAEKTDLAIGLLGADTYAIRKEIAEGAAKQRLPIVMDTPGGYTDMGGVATLGVDIVPLYREGAIKQMVPMLEGKRPSDLAWIGPDRISAKFNGEVVRSFGLTAD
ncbi:hypothetical protein CN132_35500 [Sinorhizobium meliloti]|nr:hypothetical protein CN132_35500 [Sinorhizobium meliloti]